jgi:Tol biopolymer transport system component
MLTQKRILEIPEKSGVEKVLWPKKGDNFIVESALAGGKKKWSFYDSAKVEFIDLPDQVMAVEWMPDGERLVNLWVEGGKGVWNLYKLSDNTWTTISESDQLEGDMRVSPDGLNIIYYRTERSSVVNSLYLATPDGKIWQELVKEGYNEGALWSPDSKKFLFNKKTSSGMSQLWLYNLLNGEAKDLNVNTTVDKAAWAGDSSFVYAAVPKNGASGQGALTLDSFFRIDLTSDNLDKKEYAVSASADGRDLFLNLEGDRLFFKNAQDGYLYYLNLTQQ